MQSSSQIIVRGAKQCSGGWQLYRDYTATVSQAPSLATPPPWVPVPMCCGDLRPLPSPLLHLHPSRGQNLHPPPLPPQSRSLSLSQNLPLQECSRGGIGSCSSCYSGMRLQMMMSSGGINCWRRSRGRTMPGTMHFEMIESRRQPIMFALAPPTINWERVFQNRFVPIKLRNIKIILCCFNTVVNTHAPQYLLFGYTDLRKLRDC